MRRPQYLTNAVTFLAFLSSSSISWAQSNTNYGSYNFSQQSSAGTQSTVPTFNPYPLSMVQPQTTIQAKMQACQIAAIAGNSAINQLMGVAVGANSLSSLTPTSSPGNGVGNLLGANNNQTQDKMDADCKAEKFACSLKCTPPVRTAYTCEDFYQVKKTSTQNGMGTYQQFKQHVFIGADQADQDATEKRMRDANTSVANYLDWLQFKKNNNCPSPDQQALDQSYQAYACMMSALQDATSQATGQLRTALQQNTSQYGQMNTFVQQVGDQMRQIDEVLGPDDGGNGISKLGGDQFQGLLGMQKSLRDQMTQMNTKQADFQTRVQAVQRETTENQQTLVADQMGVVSSCLKGESNIGVAGGYSLQCFKPQTSKDDKGVSTTKTDAKGNPVYAKQSCGPMEYVRSQVEQAAFVNGNRGVIRDQKRRDKAAENSSEFDALSTSIMRDLGDYDASTSDGKVVPRMLDWTSLSQKYAAEMADLSSKTGVNIQSEMNAIAGHCFSESDTWKNQQVNSSASTYNKNIQKIQGETSSLTADLNNGLSQVNAGYSAAMAVMGGQAVAISCPSTTDPTQMQNCYSSIRQNLQGLMDGTGPNTSTVKNINGGSMLPGFSVSCKGIDGCVTAFQQVRKAKNEQIHTAQKAKADFVQNSNAQVQSQLSSYSQSVAAAQKAVLAQYNSMKATTDRLGVTAPDMPNFMQGEPLEASPPTPPDTSPGPYKIPGDLTKALAGTMPAPGLINFQNTGMDKFKQAANDKFKKDQEGVTQDIKTYSESLSKMATLSSSCTANDDDMSMLLSRAGNDPGVSSCEAVSKSCADKLSSNGTGANTPADLNWMSSVIGVFMNPGAPSSPATTQAMANLSSISSANQDDDCDKAISSCRTAVGALNMKSMKTSGPNVMTGTTATYGE